MRPVILLTCSKLTDASAPPSVRSGACEADTTAARRDGLLAAYADSVALAGGSPLLLPNTPDAGAIESALEAADGLLLTGGGDVASELYGQTRHPTLGHVDPQRDRTEQLAIEQAMRRRMPILGICRGIQILNVVLGGTLIQDIPSHRERVLPGSGLGEVSVNHSGADHTVSVDTGSTLAGLWGSESATVNSTHHQAVDRPPAALKPIAHAPDGIVEAVEASDGYPLLALQCHPERLAHKDRRFLAVFEWLVRLAAAR